MNSRSSSATAKSTISTATSRSSLTPEFLARLKIQRKATLHRIEIKDLPPEQRISQLRGGRKHFVDTVKLIAATKEHPQRVDYEYERAGTASILMFCEPLGGGMKSRFALAERKWTGRKKWRNF